MKSQQGLPKDLNESPTTQWFSNITHSCTTIINFALSTATSWFHFLLFRILCSWSLYSSERTDNKYHIINYNSHFKWWQCSDEIKIWCCDSNLRTGSIRKAGLALAGMAQGIECQTVKQKVAISIPVRAHAWVAGQDPSWGARETTTH